MNTDILSLFKGKPARLVIADDHELARAGLRAMLTDQRGFALVGEASNGQEELPPGRLSPREREVLELLTKGQTNREIARKLTVSVSTVKIHVEHILAKLGVSDRTQAAVRAIETGLVSTTSME